VLGNLLHLLVIYTDTLNHVFHTVPIPLGDFLLLGLIGSSVLWVEEIRKWFARRQVRPEPGPSAIGAPPAVA
jgi:Ca2+-transporting ATPase